MCTANRNLIELSYFHHLDCHTIFKSTDSKELLKFNAIEL